MNEDKRIIQGLLEESPPCDDCPLAEACGGLGLACEAFCAWVYAPLGFSDRFDPALRLPTRTLFENLYHRCREAVMRKPQGRRGGTEAEEVEQECGVVMLAGNDGALYCPVHDAEELAEQGLRITTRGNARDYSQVRA